MLREFLLRIVDLEILPNRESTLKLFGQMGALLAAFNVLFAKAVGRVFDLPLPVEARWREVLPDEHFFLSTTMLAVGMLAILCWESAFPERRDVLVLAPLPVRTRTLFAAKLSALGLALGAVVLAVNLFTGLSYPLALGYLGGGAGAMLRWFVGWWAALLAAGIFTLGCVWTLQGLASQLLPRRVYVRFSAVLQVACFTGFLGLYFLQPPLAKASHLSGWMAHGSVVEYLPSYWFLGLLAKWTMGLETNAPVVARLAHSAEIGLLAIVSSALLLLGISYGRTMRRIVESPDIQPAGRRRGSWHLDRHRVLWGIVLFSWRTLLRSRQHRVILALYWGFGLGFALACARAMLYGKQVSDARLVNSSLLSGSLLLGIFLIVGIRVVFAIPMDLRANWIFQLTKLSGTARYLAATRLALWIFGAGPALLSAALLVVLWPAAAVFQHVLVMGALAWAVVEFGLRDFAKIPFTCSFVPGSANIHVRAGVFALLLVILSDGLAVSELRALRGQARFGSLLGFLLFIAAIGWWRRRQFSTDPLTEIVFVEPEATDLQLLQFHRDGVMPRD